MRGKKEASDIAELIKIDEADDIEWDESTAFATPFYLAGKSSDDAFRITAERLRECKIAPGRISTVLEDIEKQLDKIGIFIEYEDVFGSKFKLEEDA